jgi:hypothetical protein
MGRHQRRPNKLPNYIPDDVRHDAVNWEPTWEERALDWHRQQLELALAEVKRIELEEQKAWLTTAMQRSVAAGLLIDETERKLAQQAEMDRAEKWFADTAAREKKQNEAIQAAYQKQLDGGKFEAMVERANKAKADMDRDNARLERFTLLKRGVLRGTRKQFATPTFPTLTRT